MQYKTISLDDLASELMSVVELQQDKIVNEMLVALKDASDTTLKQVVANAPVSNRTTDIHLRDTFVCEKDGEGNKTNYQIYSKDKNYLVHILEFGFNSVRGGRFIQGKPFMLPALEIGVKQLTNDVNKILK